MLGIIFAVIVLVIFIVIVFFNISELSLIPFLAKMARNNFFDTKKKFQENYYKEDPLDVLLEENKSKEEKQVIEYKHGGLDKKQISNIEGGGLL